MGIVYILGRNDYTSKTAAHQTAVVVVWVFEVLFHLIKPKMEAVGMLLGSPFLSYITIKTGSIWPAFLIHLGVEIVFILSF
jgi:membrane protease YdiL (CAAX protease family)